MSRINIRLFFALLIGVVQLADAQEENNDSNKNSGGGPCAESGTNEQSVNLVVPCGKLNHESLIKSAHLMIEEHQPSVLVATPQALNLVVGNYVLKSVRVVDGSRELEVLMGGGKLIYFRIANGNSEGEPIGLSVGAEESIQMVADDGTTPVATNPAYYDLHDGDGNRYRFFANESEVASYLGLESMRIAGREQSVLTEMGLDVVKDVNQMISQVKTPSLLLNVVVVGDSIYRIDIYPDSVVDPKVGDAYPVPPDTPPESWVISNPDPNDLNVLTITRKIGFNGTAYQTVRTTRYEYTLADDAWTMTMDGDPRKIYNRYSQVLDTAADQRVNTRLIGRNYETADETIDYKKSETRAILDWGTPVIREEEFVGDGEPSIVTTYEYYTDSAANGYRKKKRMNRSDGYWERYAYDDRHRIVAKTTPWLDGSDESQSKVVSYGYDTLEGDEPSEYISRPRTVTESVGGVVIKKTFHAYPESGGERQEIEEQCLAGNPYGDSGNPRTTKTYYASNAGAWGGMLKSVQHSDGRKDEYIYSLGTYVPGTKSFTPGSGEDWKETVTRKAWNGSAYAEIANKSTREVRVWDRYGNEVLRQTEVYTGSGHELIDEVVSVYDDLNHPTTITYFDGTTETGEWGTGCCGKDSGTDRYGIASAYAYDAYKRVESMTRGGIDTVYSYDGKGRRLSATRLGGALSLGSSKVYDWIGRVTSSTDESGLATSTVYDDINRTETTTYPGLGTRIVTKYKDGRVKSIAGTAVVHEFYEYGCDAGAQWTKKHIGSSDASSPRLEKTIYDMAGRMEKVEKPAYGGGTLYTANAYNEKGQLESRTVGVEGSSDSTVTRYEYDEFGNVKRVGLDMDGSGPLALASTDRITDYDTRYVKEGGNWYQKDTTSTYPDNNSNSEQPLSVRKTQITGLGAVDATHGTLVAQRIDIDVYNQQTISSTYVMPDNGGTPENEQKVTRIVDVPTSSQDAVVLTRGGLKESETSTTGVTTAYGYDGLGRLESQTVHSSADDTPNDKERTVSSTYAYYDDTANTANDELVGKLKSITDEANNTVTYTYHAATGLKKTEKKTATMAAGITPSQQDIATTYSYYTDSGKLRKVEGGQYPVEYHYDNYGQMDWLKTWRDTTTTATTTWAYDPATGLLEHKRYDNATGTGKGPDYTYYSDGKLHTRTWARNAPNNQPTATYSYDGVSRELTGIVYSGTADANQTVTTANISYANYDRQGRPHNVTDGQGTRTLTYTDSGRLDAESISGVYELDRDFDAYGRPAGYVLSSPSPDQNIDYTYDAKGRFETVAFDIDSVVDTFTYTWADGADLLTGYSTAGVSPAVAVSYGYEANRDLKTSVLNQKLGTDISQFVYVYDEIGRRKQRTDTRINDSEVINKFNYNVRSEVIGADMDGTSGYEDSYNYDDIGNRIDTTLDGGSRVDYARNNLNQYTGLSGGTTASLSHDDDGNLTADGTWRYVWNAENRLVEMRTYRSDNIPVSGDKKLTFAYDFMGRRYSKVVTQYNGSSWVEQANHAFVYDGWNLIHDSGSGSYVWGLDLSQTLQGAGGVGGLLACISSGSKSYALGDANGNITDYVGDHSASFKYDAFGKVSNGSYGSDQDLFPFRFSSKYQDAETDLSYYGYRYFTPVIGRWLNRDPIGEIGGENLYGMSDNNCGDYADVDGRGLWPSKKERAQRRFDKWYKNEKKRGDDWVQEIKNEGKECPETLDVGEDCQGKNPDSKKWDDPTKIGEGFKGGIAEKYHPGGAYEMRSKPTKNGHGNQCVYDKDGKLITGNNAAAGSADFVAPGGGYSPGHIKNDVDPFHDANIADTGSKCPSAGEMTPNVEKYYEVRPQIY